MATRRPPMTSPLGKGTSMGRLVDTAFCRKKNKTDVGMCEEETSSQKLHVDN